MEANRRCVFCGISSVCLVVWSESISAIFVILSGSDLRTKILSPTEASKLVSSRYFGGHGMFQSESYCVVSSVFEPASDL